MFNTKMHLDMKLYSRSFSKICSIKGHKMNDSVVKVSMNKFYVTWNLKFKQTDTKIKTVYRDTACQWCKGSQKKPKENYLLQNRDINKSRPDGRIVRFPYNLIHLLCMQHFHTFWPTWNVDFFI